MSVDISLGGKLDCFADFVERTLPSVFFLVPLPNCFLRVCVRSIFAAVRKLFLPLTTFDYFCHSKVQEVNTDACRNSDTFFTHKTIWVSPSNSRKCQEWLSRMSITISKEKTSNCLETIILKRLCSTEILVGGLSKHQHRTMITSDKRDIFYQLVSLKSRQILWKEKSSGNLKRRLLEVF